MSVILLKFMTETCWENGIELWKLCSTSAWKLDQKYVSWFITSSWFYSQSYNPRES